jgi:hypothetical protein
MAAHKHLSGQLSMFLPARELMKYPSEESEQGLSLSEDTELHEDKLGESMNSMDGLWLLSDVKKHGVTDPITIKISPSGKQTIDDGHHRIASANHVNPDMEVPVRYS